MKLVDTVYKKIEQLVEKYVIEFSPEELRYIRWLAAAAAAADDAERLHNKLIFVENVVLAPEKCFL